ncbi:ATP-binding protein [Rubrivirga sp.]|uniref:ATP-binding protein n=1 Tax=Rubrivirga sp. TaxID=1885344 RepID=UPI003B52F41B
MLLLVGGVALLTVGWLYQFGAPEAVDPRAGRLAIGLSALSVGVLTFTSAAVRRHAYTLIYALFFVVSAWQIAVATGGGLTPTSAFSVILVFLGCSAGIQTPRLLAVYTGLFVGAMAVGLATIPEPGVPPGAFLATLGSLGALGVFVARARLQSLQTLHDAKEEALDAARAKAEFLAAMSHEIRTPLNGVIGMTDVLATTPLSADQRDCVDTIQASGRALLGVINDVLDFSKIEAGRLELEAEPVRLQALADEAVTVVAPVAAQKGLEVVCHLSPSVPAVVLADGARLRQIALNLLANAVKFTPSGTVTLRLDARRFWAHVDVIVRVSDTGIGIPADHLDRLFDSFSQVDASTTRRFGGTGLGLAITKRLVEQMNGTVRVESEVGAGSAFTVTIPLPVAEGPPAPAAPAGTLLLVEPHDGARAAVAVLAERHGLDVVAHATPDQALAWADGGGRYDVAAVAGGGARDLADRLRAEHGRRGQPVVLLAPIGSDAVPEGVFDAVLGKPVGADRFAYLMAHLTEGPQVLAEPRPREPIATNVRVLLVEDHEVNRKVAVGLLARLGVTPDVAEDGAQALDALEASAYDLVLMDLQMPVLDGIEATRQLRETLPAERQPRVVALTANAFSEDAARCREVGMDGFLTKPVRLADLRSELARLHSGPPSGAAPASSRPAPEPTAGPSAGPTAETPVLGEALGPAGIIAHLRALADGDDALATEILEAYLRTEPTLRRELTDGEPASAAHKLKSACGTLGADALAHAAFEIERDVRNGADVSAAVRALDDGLGRFRQAAQEALAALTAPA